MTPYQPVPCDFHDQLLAYATLRQEVEVVFTEGDTERTIAARITDVYTRDKSEYLLLSEGTTVRLDRLRRVGGTDLTFGACSPSPTPPSST